MAIFGLQLTSTFSSPQVAWCFVKTSDVWWHRASVAFALSWCELDTNLLHESLDRDTKENTKKGIQKNQKKTKKMKRRTACTKRQGPRVWGRPLAHKMHILAVLLRRENPNALLGIPLALVWVSSNIKIPLLE
jgi:hypothetical protein